VFGHRYRTGGDQPDAVESGSGDGEIVSTSPSMSSTTVSPTSATPPVKSDSTAAPSPSAWESADFGSLDAFIESTDGEAFAIWENGAMVHEWYRTDALYTRDIASSQKSILSLLVGRAIGDSLVEFDTLIDDVPGRGWTPHGQSARIAVEHLLAMTSGLDNTLEVVAAPGERWIYSGAFAALFDVLTAITERELDENAQSWLFDPAGARNSVFYERPAGIFAPIGLRSTVPDRIAIGQLVLDGGPPELVVARLGGRAVPASQAAWSPFDVDLWERLIAVRG